jgi:hypothetical protein
MDSYYKFIKIKLKIKIVLLLIFFAIVCFNYFFKLGIWLSWTAL